MRGSILVAVVLSVSSAVGCCWPWDASCGGSGGGGGLTTSTTTTPLCGPVDAGVGGMGGVGGNTLVQLGEPPCAGKDDGAACCLGSIESVCKGYECVAPVLP